MLFGITVWGQSTDISKDDEKFLKLSLLINLAQADLLTINQTLIQKEYSLGEISSNSDFISYKYVRYNFFTFKRFVTIKKVLYKFGYTDALYSKYISEINSLNLQPFGSPPTPVLIDNGFKSSYEDSAKNWLITLSIVKPSEGQATVEISISSQH